MIAEKTNCNKYTTAYRSATDSLQIAIVKQVHIKAQKKNCNRS